MIETNKKKRLLIYLVLISLSFSGGFMFGNKQETENDKSKNVTSEYIVDDLLELEGDSLGGGYYSRMGGLAATELLPTEDMAVQVAEIILKKRFGESEIDSQKPFHIRLIDNVWVIEGDFKELGHSFGGSAHIEISRNNGQILRLYHSK